MWVTVSSCGGDDGEPATEEIASAKLGLVRGRVRSSDGSELERVTVRVEGQSARTDNDGLFELEVPVGAERRIRVDSPDLAGGEAVVEVQPRGVTNLELAVMGVRTLVIPDAERGGRFEGVDGFAIELPERSLRLPDGEVATGEAELRYAAVRSPRDMAVPPDMRTKDADGNDVRLRGHGMLEVRFYQRDERLTFEGTARTEMRLPETTSLRDGDVVGMYHYDLESLRWVRETEASIEDDLWVARLDRFSWWAAAEEADSLGCVSAQLRTPAGDAAEGVVVTAIGVSDLWLSTALSDEDGEFCLEAPRGTSLSMSAFLETDDERGEWSTEDSVSEEAGMCGGDGCNDLGEQEFEGGPISRPGVDDGGTGTQGDGGTILEDGGDTLPDGGAGEDGSVEEDGGVDEDGGVEEDGGVDEDGGFEGTPFSDLTLTSESADGNAAVIPFDALGGERLAYTVGNDADTTVDVRIYDPQGDQISGAGLTVLSGNNTYHDDFRLPNQTGEYRMEITPRNGGSGSFDVNLFGVPDDIEAAIDADGVAGASLLAIGQNFVVTLEGSPNQRLAYRVTNDTNGTVDVTVTDPTFNNVANSGLTVLTGRTTFQDAFRLPALSGTYTFLLNPRGQAVGTVSLELLSVPDDVSDTANLDDPSPVSVSLLEPGQNGAFTFSASGGDRVAYYADNQTSGTVDTRVVDPSGNVVSGSSITSLTGRTVFQDIFILPAGVDGTYSVTANPRGEAVGDVAVTLIRVPADTQTGPVGLPTSSAINYRTVSIGTEAQNGAVLYQVPAVTGGGDAKRLAYFVSNETDGTLDIELRDPSGSRVPNSNTTSLSGQTDQFVSRFALPDTDAGVYALFVNPRSSTTGNVRVYLYEITPATVTASVPIGSVGTNVAVTIPGQIAEITFEVPAGETFQYSVAANGAPAGQSASFSDLVLRTDGGSTVPSTGAGSVGPGSSTNPATVTSSVLTSSGTGVYILELDPRSAGVNDYDFSLVVNGAQF